MWGKCGANSKNFHIFAPCNLYMPLMIKIELRNSKDSVGTLSVRIANRKLKIDTNISLHLSIKTKDWVEAMQLPKNVFDNRPVLELNGMSYATLTEKLQKIKTTLKAVETAGTLNKDNAREIINDILKDDLIEEAKAHEPARTESMTFADYVQQYIQECENGERLKKKSTHKIKESSIKSYRSLLLRIRAYEQKRKRIIGFDDITFDFYDDFKRFLVECQFAPNTIAKHIKDMKTILFAAKDQHLITRDDFTSKKWSADKEDVNNIYIPTERLKEMIALDLADEESMLLLAKKHAKDDKERDDLVKDLKRGSYRRRLAEARDIFILGCLTGQRVSDYKRINNDMIETIVGNRQFLHLVQIKTGKDVYIPWNDMIGEILARYNGGVPKIQDQHLNKLIKIVGLLCGWTENAGLEEHKGIMSYQSKKRFCDAIMTHTARRTFATNAYKAGISLSSIMAVTGHSSEEMLKRYLKLDSKERALLAAVEFDKVII